MFGNLRAPLSFLLLAVLACTPPAPDGLTEPPPGSGTHSVTLAWDAPTTDARGDPLSDLAAYRLYVGSETPLIPEGARMIDVGTETTYTVTDLEPGVYYFAVSAVDIDGNESALSQEVSAQVGGS